MIASPKPESRRGTGTPAFYYLLIASRWRSCSNVLWSTTFLLSLDCFERVEHERDRERTGGFLLSLDCFRMYVKLTPTGGYVTFYYLLIASNFILPAASSSSLSFYYLLIASPKPESRRGTGTPAFYYLLIASGGSGGAGPKRACGVPFYYLLIASSYRGDAGARERPQPCFLLSLDCFLAATSGGKDLSQSLSTIS